MLRKYSFVLSAASVLAAIGAVPAKANYFTNPTATLSCTGVSNLTGTATDLTPGNMYIPDYTFTAACNGGSPFTLLMGQGSVFTATGTSQPITIQPGNFSPGLLVGTCQVTGTGTLNT